MIEKYESRRIRLQIRHVLLRTWDPIGIADEPNAQDEYDSYVGPVFELLANKASDAELTEFLYQIVHERMGLSGATRSHMVGTIEALRKISMPIDQTEP